VSVDGPVVDKLIKENTYYGPATIPGGMYTGNPEDTKTFGVAATMVTTADVSDTMVYELVKAVFTNFNAFKKQHPAFGVLTKEGMVHNNNSAPYHPGAVKYYEEAGLLK
jgi:TRAP transporter TAXI family solute receptor